MADGAPSVPDLAFDGEASSIKRDGEHLVIRLPIVEAHSLRVALQPCPCKGAKSASTADIRIRMSKAIAKAIFAKPRDGG
ncbi:hypothetical protein [Vannielia litorea]|uniref:hypothetical protein n=1 Tax=Vannielia litorea TaxID=1217970 RepID=UPI001BD0E8D8|nr:hypothetical protein [Vannielia litorea]MBS8227123.1 hypothetical protein [Vannielia litorea]